MDGKAFGAEMVEIVKGHMERSLAPIMHRLEVLEKSFADLPIARDGRDADMDQVKKMVADMVAQIPEPKNGRDADPEVVRQMVEAAVAELPPAEKGRDADPVEVAAQIAVEVERAVAALPVPQPGKSVTVDELLPQVEQVFAKAVAALPVAKDGTDGKDGRDGADVVDLLIDRDGALVATLSNGRTKSLGPVVGKDGEQGAPGRDGVNGLGFEDMSEELADDGRTIIRRYARGDQAVEFRHSMAIVLDRGVFKEGSTYQAGDGVTWGGSFWIAQEETTEKPDSGKGWRLAVKRGRDGKDGQMKPAADPKPVKVG